MSGKQSVGLARFHVPKARRQDPARPKAPYIIKDNEGNRTGVSANTEKGQWLIQTDYQIAAFQGELARPKKDANEKKDAHVDMWRSDTMPLQQEQHYSPAGLSRKQIQQTTSIKDQIIAAKRKNEERRVLQEARLAAIKQEKNLKQDALIQEAQALAHEKYPNLPRTPVHQ